MPLLIRNFRTSFYTDEGVARAVDGVSLTVSPGETLGVVGESGCGKSVTALSILRLVRPPGKIEPGSTIELDGQDVLALDDAALRHVRGNRIAMVFQEPMTALNPVLTVGEQIAEVVRVHEPRASRQEAWDRAVDMLDRMGIPGAADRAHHYPHELSGGTRQRVMIAMALVMNPAVLIADEPTTALDVTVQAQILELLADLQRRLGMAVLLITHDLGVVAGVATRVAVMYAGEIVEEASVGDFFARPHHPYATGLLHAMPRLGARRERLEVIPGAVPSPTAWPDGCRFRARCQFAWERCATEHPPLYHVTSEHTSRCHLAVEPERRGSANGPQRSRLGDRASV